MSHKSVMYEQNNEVLELLHLDVVSPCLSILLEVHVTYYSLSDDYSDMYFTYFLKNKSDGFSIFIIFKEKCKNVLNKKIKCIRTDNSKEFINNEFREFINEADIEHQKHILITLKVMEK